MNRTDIEALVTTCFSRCPFCFVKSSMKFEWGPTIPKRMTCSNCEAKWELLFGLNKTWRFLGAKLVDTGSTRKGAVLKGKMYSKEFWEKTAFEGTSAKPLALAKERTSVAEKVIIIKEIVKIRCPYCGALYDEVNDKCPHCGGKR